MNSALGGLNSALGGLNSVAGPEAQVLLEMRRLSGIPPYIFFAAIQDLDRYAEAFEREACGMVVRWRGNVGGGGVWSWKLLSNVIQGEAGRHQFEMDERGVRMVLSDLEGLVEGEVVAIIHSHPFAQSGEPGAVGPSYIDILNRRSAERDARADGGRMPDSLLWLPKAGSSGVLMGYNGEGETWSVVL